MITDEVSIYNLALSAVGTRSTVSLPQEKSREAEICRLWFGPVRDHTLRAAPWPSAKKWGRLALRSQATGDVWQPGDPQPGYGFAYAPPNDMLAPRYLAGYDRFELTTYGDTQKAIETDVSDAVLCYTFQQKTIGNWDVNLQMAIAYALAAFISMPLHAKSSRTDEALKQANSLILQAREEAANTDMAREDSIPSWISIRGFGGPKMATRFYHPLGSLFAIGALGVK